jgi:hypothetical protein
MMGEWGTSICVQWMQDLKRRMHDEPVKRITALERQSTVVAVTVPGTTGASIPAGYLSYLYSTVLYHYR